MEFIRNAFRKSGRGFTLIELLVVIAIIGILASIVLASLNSARRKSRDARRIADIKQIQLALELYADASSQLYPLAVAWSGVNCDVASSKFLGLEVLAPNYIPSVPRDPNRDNSSVTQSKCYPYATNAGTAAGEPVAKSNYHLAAFLEESTNAALGGDRGCDSSAVNGCMSVAAAYTAGFDGEDANCDTTVAAGADQCYDVTN